MGIEKKETKEKLRHQRQDIARKGLDKTFEDDI
jgi:hypothetical protein